ncbi:TPA: TrlF family AAA-like ATPase [Pseudomonas aeruginosa]|uniref:TrlF family AAA-like ATPase n=1 Tax=Pseudomonas aeruginosa TaxID=287 RepID=UPI002954798F|nr:AAA family ATPase [Pseudomonas aeruginosa]MDV7945696.1 AAA family ATPase [Pseudomonas aeruginosa]
MADEFDVQSDLGSLWHRWDPHIHTPGTALNDQYTGPDPWEEFLSAIEASSPPIRALGITDYFGIERYEQVVDLKKQGRLPGVGLIFPNVELRLGIETAKASAVNIHLLFSPHDSDHVERIKRFLLEFEFPHLGETYRCHRDDLIRLGRTHKAQLTDDDVARSEGANQFKVTFDQLKQALSKNEWVKKNTLIAVAGGEKDGSSGLRDATGSFAAQRKNIEGLAHIVFSANPKQIRFWLGKESASVDELESQYNGCKPCLHGSDAHSVAKVGQPDGDRRCWIKGDLTFDSLRQICIEPEERVFVGAEPPRGALDSHAIKSVSVTNAPWIANGAVALNAGLVAVIGARGSGKTALADLIAAGGLALSPHLNERSFIHRAKQHLGDSEAELHWASGEKTGNQLTQTDMEDYLASPYVQYLSQQFVDQLCSAEGLDDALVAEIERVIFNAHPLADRQGADSFMELLNIRLDSSRQMRERQQQALTRASADLTDERVRKDGLKALEKDRDEKKRAIDKDKTDRDALIPKGNEERARRHEQISLAVDAKRQQVDQAVRKHQSLLNLQNDVRDFRSRQAPAFLADLKRDRENAGLSDADWDSFKLDFVGPVDLLLTEQIKQASLLIAELQGPANTDPMVQANPDPTVALISLDSSLANQSLSLLERELARIRTLVGVDTQNAKRFTTLSDKITRAETALNKVLQQIERAQGADERIRVLLDTRRTAYAAIFEAIVEEEKELVDLYGPIKSRIDEAAGSLSKLSFSVRRVVDLAGWAAKGENLLDLRTNGPFKGRGELLRCARAGLLSAWSTGDATQAATALLDFVKTNESALRDHMPENADFRAWARDISDWLYSTDHITVGYGLQYDGVDIEQLSPGTRGIVLLLLYLAIDAEDDRPLIIDQPEENLDPQSIFEELVHRFRDAKKRRQIIIVTHNANLVVNTDADQVIVAKCGSHRPGKLPLITYVSGSLENPLIRQHVCEILEGGERAFKERAKRLRVSI